jgi:hypothetical protein
MRLTRVLHEILTFYHALAMRCGLHFPNAYLRLHRVVQWMLFPPMRPLPIGWPYSLRCPTLLFFGARNDVESGTSASWYLIVRSQALDFRSKRVADECAIPCRDTKPNWPPTTDSRIRSCNCRCEAFVGIANAVHPFLQPSYCLFELLVA